VSIPVVGAAIIHDGYVLAARRALPGPLAGGWEFPGGKVESGESDVVALTRECREELGVTIEVGERLGAVTNESIRLTLYAATLVEGQPEPLEDHDEFRWLGVAELDDVAWLPIDLALLPQVRALLGLSRSRSAEGRAEG
jgi:8-oxo-dGTP diphosphatase